MDIAAFFVSMGLAFVEYCAFLFILVICFLNPSLAQLSYYGMELIIKTQFETLFLQLPTVFFAFTAVNYHSIMD